MLPPAVPADGEGVIYALSEAAANQEMGTRCGSDGDDLVLLNEQEEPTEVCMQGVLCGLMEGPCACSRCLCTCRASTDIHTRHAVWGRTYIGNHTCS